MQKRKIVYLTLLVYLLVIASAFAQEQFTFTVKKAGEDVTILQLPYLYNLNMIVVDCGEFLTLVDTFSSTDEAESARLRIKELINKPVKYIINTHHHWDHTFGNQVFPEAEIIAHEYCPVDMKADYANKGMIVGLLQSEVEAMTSRLEKMEKGSDSYEKTEGEIFYFNNVVEDFLKESFKLTLPTCLVGDKEDLRLGNKTFRLYNVAGLHTRSHLIIHIPEAGVVVKRPQFRKSSLINFEEGLQLDRLIKSTEEILSSPEKLNWLVVGHGDPVPAEKIDLQLDYLKAIKQVIDAAASLAEAEKAFPLGEFSQAQRLQKRHKNNIKIAWESRDN